MTLTMARSISHFHEVVVPRDAPARADRAAQDVEDSSKLPSIRQMLPEFGLGITTSVTPSTSSLTTSPSTSDAGMRSPPEYVYSPNPSKRRRVSVGEEDEERASPRRQPYTPPWNDVPSQPARHMSVEMVPRSATDSWTGPSPVAQKGSLPPIWSAVAIDGAEAAEHQRTQASVSSLVHSPTRQPLADNYPRERSRGLTFPDYNQRPGTEHGSAPYQSGGFYMAHRAPSLSVPPTQYGRNSYDSANHYRRNSYDPVQHYPDYMHVNEHGEMGPNGHNKAPKKRGNLPKDTTDKLLAWFHSHLDHPYPTEEEKHKLMRQTGLQMNQISNWFINIRRRKWPEVRRERQAAATASGRSTDGSVLSATERSEYENDERRRSCSSGHEGTTSADDSRASY